MRFAGRLYVGHLGTPGFPVVLDFHRDHLVVTGQDQSLGSWPLEEVWLEPMGDGRFTLSVGDDHLLLVPQDPLELEYQVIPVLERTRRAGGVLHRLRSWMDTQLPPSHPDRPPVELPEEPASSVVTLSAPPLPDPVPPPPLPRRCSGRRRDGEPCRSPVIAASGYCFAHDPNRTEEERRRARLRATAPPDPADLTRRLRRALDDLHRGRLDPATATAVAELIRTIWLVTGDHLEAARLSEPAEHDRPRPEVTR